MNKNDLLVGVLVAVVALLGVGLLKPVEVNVDVADLQQGAIPGPEVYQDMTFHGTVGQKAPVTLVAATSVYSTTTINLNQSGTIFSHSASGTTMTLPSVDTAGKWLEFVAGGDLDTGNVIIDSAEGDNIEGTLIVAGAVVDCDAEDQINFVVVFVWNNID